MPDDRKLFLTPQELVSRYEGRVNVRTLANWRSAGVSPPFTKVGGRILYPLNELIEWERKRTVGSTSGYKRCIFVFGLLAETVRTFLPAIHSTVPWVA